jgi:hypothetical protein
LAKVFEDSDSDENDSIKDDGANFYNSVNDDRLLEILSGVCSVANVVV